MRNFQLKSLIIAVALASSLSACKKDKINPTPVVPAAERAGIYVLSQGNLFHNNSILGYYNYATKTITADIFATANKRGLGDTGNDAQIYGSKMYMTVNYSSTIEIVDAKTAKSIKQIKMTDGATNRQPRYVVFNKNKAFISSYDGTVAVLDTATLTIDKFIKVGRNPEQMVVSNGKLYVANSGGLTNTRDFDKTVSVIDLNTLVEVKKIEVIANPGTIAADNYGNVYVLSTGNYDDIAPGMTIINNVTDAVKTQSTIAGAYGTSMIIDGDFAYLIAADYKILVYNVKTQKVVTDNFTKGGPAITSPYNIAHDSITGEVFVTDALDYSSNGRLFAYDKNGNYEYDVATGINPGAIVFVNK